MTGEVIEKIKRIVIAPESLDERIIHEALEFVVYGVLFGKVKEWIREE